MKKGLLIILSGPSGVGKGTIRKKIFKNKKLNLVYSISMTTRKPRKKEIPNVDYYFVSEDIFKENIKNDNFLEYCQFVGNYYGTPKDKVEQWIGNGKNVLLEIEINGANQVLSKVKGDNIVSIFLLPPSLEELEKRIRLRKSESEEVIKERLEKARREINKTEGYDYIVINDDLNRASKEISEIILNKLKNISK